MSFHEIFLAFEQIDFPVFIAAGICGLLIGFEREARDKGAGIRTHTLVSLGACLFTIISMKAAQISGGDPTRVAAQIVSGIGFLGGGAIFQEKDRVRGLTTAATIWIAAAIGMACGFGQIPIAITVTVFSIIIIFALRTLSKKLRRPRMTWVMTLHFEDEMTSSDMNDLEKNIEVVLQKNRFKLLELTEKSDQLLELVIRGQGKLMELAQQVKAVIGEDVKIEVKEF